MGWLGVNIEKKQADIERTLESKSDEVATLEQRIYDLVEKLEAIESTAARVSQDDALIESLGETRNERERQRLDEKQNAVVLLSELAFLLDLVNEGEESSSRDSEALDALRSLGENVDEADSIVQERREWAEATRKRISDLMERIGGKVTEPLTEVTASRRLSNNIDGDVLPQSADGDHRYIHPGSMVESRFQKLVEVFGATNPLGWIDAGNPLFSTGASKWMLNCGSCARSFADTYHGISVAPAMGDDGTPPGEYQEMWDSLDCKPTSRLIRAHSNAADFQTSAFRALETTLAREGVGAVAIIGVDWDIPGESRDRSGGHWFNAYVDQNGQVKWADLQTGKVGDWPPKYYADFWRIEAVVRQSAESPWKDLVL